MTACSTCGRVLDETGEPFSVDCGGDCIGCMIFVGGDPDCLQAMKAERLDPTYWLNEHVRYRTSFFRTLVEAAERAKKLVDGGPE